MDHRFGPAGDVCLRQSHWKHHGSKTKAREISTRRLLEAQKAIPWDLASIPAKFDIRKLMPSFKARGERFETVTDAKYYNDLTVGRLRGGEYICEAIADEASECRPGIGGCLHPNCSLCARLYRLGLIAQALLVFNAHGRDSLPQLTSPEPRI